MLAFAHFGGVPARIRYDNLKAAVAKVLFGRDRVENERFVALRSHYGFDSFYCRPGIEGAHEKGGVEGEVGRFRRRHLVPVPRVGVLAELNELMAAGDRVDDDRQIGRRPDTVGRRPPPSWPGCGPLPEVAVRHRGDPARGQGRHQGPDLCAPKLLLGPGRAWPAAAVAVRLGAQTLRGGRRRAGRGLSIERSLHKGTEDLVLDHYLEILVRKPGALPGSTALGPGPGGRGVRRHP